MSRSSSRAEASRGYAICTTQRTGSNYLCQLLTSTGVLGRPLDYFNAQGRRSKGWSDYPDDPERQLGLILRHGATENGIYGFKLFAHDFDRLAPLPWTKRLPGLQWIYLHRADLLGQAISLLIAKQTGRWRSTAAAGDKVSYNRAALDREITDIARDNQDWQSYFARNGIAPLVLRYEDLISDPAGAARSVARLLGVSDTVRIDPSLVDVDIQRDAVNQEWRVRYLGDKPNPAIFRAQASPRATSDVSCAADRAGAIWYPAVRKARPTLTVSIVTRNSQQRLPRLLAEAAGYADQILVGVDAASDDGTFELASRHADTVYRFRLRQPGQLAPVRMLALDYATSDWILSLDDDEGMDTAFESLLPKLLAADGVTHHHFPRKWVISEHPAAYLHAPPWYPNWARRMFRNDRSLVWKPSQPHSQHLVQGPGHYESGTSILHFEPILTSADQRWEKIHDYRRAGAATASESFYSYSAKTPRRPVQLRPVTPLGAERPNRKVHSTVHELEAAAHPPWGSIVLATDLPPTAAAGELLLVEVKVRNTGQLAWSPNYARWPTRDWPLIRLSYNLLRPDGTSVDPHTGRTEITRLVAPGDEVTLVHEFRAPATPGDYIVEWDMLNEYECWFATCGGTVRRDQLQVVRDPKRSWRQLLK